MECRNIKLVLAYDGTDYAGWQLQNDQRTVQGELEAALSRLHKHPVRVAGAGRTDAGVHARAQVANFATDIERMAAEKFVPALNGLLPADIRVTGAEAAAPKFHARFDAKKRSYRYSIITGRQALPFESRYAMQLWRVPDIARLNAYARRLRGEMDCGLFASPRDKSLSRYRFIHSASFFADGQSLCFEICANAFLWKMVRSIVGSLLHYEERALSEADFASLLQLADHKLAGPTAPPQGLTLWKVEY
jgi:tRNA pseudouridine38-40 synthase